MSQHIYEFDGSRIQTMLQIEILKKLGFFGFKKKKKGGGEKKERNSKFTDLAAIAFHRVISSETDKTTHFTSLRSFMWAVRVR